MEVKLDEVLTVFDSVVRWERFVVPNIERLDDAERDRIVVALAAVNLAAATRIMRDVVVSDDAAIVVMQRIGSLLEISSMRPFVADVVFGYGTSKTVSWLNRANLEPSVAASVAYHISPMYEDKR